MHLPEALGGLVEHPLDNAKDPTSNLSLLHLDVMRPVLTRAAGVPMTERCRCLGRYLSLQVVAEPVPVRSAEIRERGYRLGCLDFKGA